ncbi:uridine kinase [Anaerotignum lactatifermentans]|uniref:Uridine kinase n=1 Tax=Anaerotignum lactatifermentans TaxID=160404 RepID=A0ABS2G6E3_9FIRM|nr:uridine kinase [Anaerotignum lactatifermentans]MBM6828699.1 uridine kinase [Anaerotignum lactatifermentans]MBM6877026.1 uridine kinase [Anaerotignum lactatifermentans]MBM6950281.1 uridine kinase [Anaerotignum lactatifermentans]
MDEIMIIGIAGGTGSGKTTLTNRIKERFGEDVTVVYHDNYYKRHDEMTYEERCLLNYDHPDAFDTDLMIEHIKKLRQGETVQCPVYDFTVHNRSDRFTEIRPTKVILIEGILIFENQELRDLMDIKVFVDTDADVRILRRILRDVKERGRSLDSVVSQYLNTVKPMHEQFVEPSKRSADIIVLEGGQNVVALDILIQRIYAHVHKEERA